MSSTTSSLFNETMLKYKSHQDGRTLEKAFKKATSQDENTPDMTALTTILADPFTTSFFRHLHSIPLIYTPMHMERTISIHHEYTGSSTHSALSLDRRASDLHGVRTFKATIVVHQLLRNARTSSVNPGDEIECEIRRSADDWTSVKDELQWWTETVMHDIKHGCGGTTGYGTLVSLYLTYLKAYVAMFPDSSSMTPLSAIRTLHADLALANHTLREALKVSIETTKSFAIGAKRAAFILVLQDAVEFSTLEEKLPIEARDKEEDLLVITEGVAIYDGSKEEIEEFLERCKSWFNRKDLRIPRLEINADKEERT